jgi:hypothetical protein
VKPSLPQVVLGAVGLAVGCLAVVSLREATLSTHDDMDPTTRMEVVVSASLRNAEPSQTLPGMVEAQVLRCRLEVATDVVGDIEELGDDRFRAVIAPALDQTDRRQFRGCLNDWTIDHVGLNVISLDVID